MTSRSIWLLSQIARRIWFRATLFSVLAVATALVAIWASPYIPSDLPTKIGADAVDNILGIIASSMLTVTTFSLSTMVSAYSAATNNVSPRATKLLMEDSTTQNVLATFIGSFLFSLVGIVTLSTGAYGERGRVVLFAVTILVIILIVVTLLRWIDHLSRLGRLTETTERVEAATIAAMRVRHRHPYLECSPLLPGETTVPNHAKGIFSPSIGYVQHIDIDALAAVAEKGNQNIFVLSIPGKLVDPTQPLAWVENTVSEDEEASIRSAFAIGDTRSFDQDPRFGASVLAEIASRALSPAINDPGTAIDIIGRAMRVLSVWNEPLKNDAKIRHPNVHIPPIKLTDLFDDLFTPIARDGAGIVEIGIRLQKAFRSLAAFNDIRFSESAKHHSRLAMLRAEKSLGLEFDKDRVKAVADFVDKIGP
ncbi:DUF2254 domain-containing protein [Rhizobium herbae]